MCYLFFLTGSQRSLPVGQMISQSHDANFIRFWLSSYFADIKNPNEIIIDASEALISASVQAFTEHASTNKYLTGCMKSLLGYDPPPPCLIRIDRSHFVASISRNAHLRNEDERVSRLTKGVIGYLIQCSSLDVIKSVLTKMFILIKNEYINGDVIAAKTFLGNLVKTHMTHGIFRSSLNFRNR